MRRMTVVSLGAAVGLSLALVLAGFLAPFSSSESSSSSSESSSGHPTSSSEESVTSSETLVEAEGLNVLIVLSIPLIISLLTVAMLRTDRRKAAWLLTGSLGCFAVLALLSIGIFVLPVVIALAIASGTARPGAL